MPANIYPNPISGQGPFGRVPGLLSLPTPAADLGAQYPNLGRTNAALSASILSGLEGQLSPGTIAALQDANAAFGIQSGMPGLTPGSFVSNRLGRNIGLTAEQLQSDAARRYASIIPTIAQTQTVSPELQTQIATQNALNLAAPDPAAAQSYAQRLFNQYLSSMRGGAGRIAFGGPAGGTRGPMQAGDIGGQIVAPSLGTGYNYPEGTITPDVYSRWGQWASGLSGAGTSTGTGYTYQAGNEFLGPNMLSEDEFLQDMGVDVYGPSAGTGSYFDQSISDLGGFDDLDLYDFGG